MGSAKALLEFDGEPLIVHLVRQLGQWFDDIVVVAAPEQQLPTLGGDLGTRRGRLSGTGRGNLLRLESGARRKLLLCHFVRCRFPQCVADRALR